MLSERNLLIMERREGQKREIGEDIRDLELFLRENIHSIFGIINAVRHGHTAYSEKYPDLTEEGVAAIRQTSEQIIQQSEQALPKEDTIIQT